MSTLLSLRPAREMEEHFERLIPFDTPGDSDIFRRNFVVYAHRQMLVEEATALLQVCLDRWAPGRPYPVTLNSTTELDPVQRFILRVVYAIFADEAHRHIVLRHVMPLGV